MGVLTVADIDYGQIFGPFPIHMTATDPAYIIGMVTNDKQPEGASIKVNTEELRDGPGALDWLPYVSMARDEAEQNMEAYFKEGGVYYRTLRIVRAGEELLVWYSKDFTHLLGVPELATNSKRDDEQYICPHCGEMFDYPFPLRAHLKFKCAFAADLKTYNSSLSVLPTKSDICDKRKSWFNDRAKNFPPLNPNNCITNINNNNNNSMFALPAKRHLEEADDRASPAKLLCSPDKDKPRSASSLKYSIEELSKSSVPENCKTLKNRDENDGYQENASAFRKVEKSSAERSEKSISPSIERNTSPYPRCLLSIEDRSSPPLSNGSLSSPSSVSSPPFSSLGSIALPTAHSPMIQGSPPSSPRQFLHQSPSASMPPPSRPPPKSTMPSSSSNSAHFEDPGSRNPAAMGLFMPRIPVFPPPAMLGIPRSNILSPAGSSNSSPNSPPLSASRGLSMQHSGFPADQIPPGLLEMCRATIPTVGPLTESFAANIRNSESLAKHALFADRHISSLGFLKSSNPMVEKLLQSTNPTLLSSPINALNLSQNWCAKCNATFRMTSDLVYHMRSHHKREFDPMKRKREEKLKCNICNEAFRERHHLTRHMSSHA
ncbi:PR domain Zinc finger protein 8-like [Plakobranchus ocellatus]|uniref:PR domain Zinc finger protein 8-like n=1 Tax=Plakobranchus ocellatus TaxID=259542 RepID=A0AAV4D1Q4_9GAST|nr:PR domain Zinc finger protein 8-like [Plakobranchus ocellatus]